MRLFWGAIIYMTERLSDDKRLLIKQNIENIRERIEKAAARAGRNTSEIDFVAVTKTQPYDAINAVIENGIKIIAENRVQELTEKIPHVNLNGASVHLIGHLQTNKMKYIVNKVDMIQSLDSINLAREIDIQSKAAGKTFNTLIEVNIAEEQSKTGIKITEVYNFLEQLETFDNIKVCGLMCIPPFDNNIDKIRPYFEQMRKLFIDIRKKKSDNSNINILSMGMSSDFEVAIEEGSNMVRIGTAIFGQRIYK
jgi:pyridoxal phosphate enzyme (YggS family)